MTTEEKKLEGKTLEQNEELAMTGVLDRLRRITEYSNGNEKFLALLDCIPWVVHMMDIQCSREGLTDAICAIAGTCDASPPEVWGMAATVRKLGPLEYLRVLGSSEEGVRRS